MLKKLLLFILGFFLCANTVSAEYLYFFGNGCGHCARVEKFFKENDIEKKYNINEKEVFYNRENSKLFLEYGAKLGIESQKLGVPFMVLEDKKSYISGDAKIIEYFRGKLNTNLAEEEKTSQQEVNTVQTKNGGFWKFIIILFPAAIADSINPCVFAVMLILLGSILSKFNSYRKMVFSGLLFILAIFISYFLIGVGLYKALASLSSAYTFYFKLGVAILGTLVGLVNLKDFFWYGKGFIMEVPLSWRPKMKALLDSAISPAGAFVIGIIVSLFLLPCTSGPYFTILGYLASESKSITIMGYMYLLIYNIIFILPMLVIIGLVTFGYKSIPELKEYKDIYKKEIHLIVGLLMLLLSGYVFWEIFFI